MCSKQNQLVHQFIKIETRHFFSHNASNTHEANQVVNSQVTDMILGWLNEH